MKTQQIKGTILDDLTEYLVQTDGITNDEMIRFKQFVLEEAYDTDAVFIDLKDLNSESPNISLSNILTLCSPTSSSIFAHTICQYVKQKQCMCFLSEFC